MTDGGRKSLYERSKSCKCNTLVVEKTRGFVTVVGYLLGSGEGEVGTGGGPHTNRVPPVTCNNHPY